VREKSVTSISRHSRQERVCTFERLFVRAEKKRHIVGHDSEGLVKGIPANVIVWPGTRLPSNLKRAAICSICCEPR